MKQTYNVLILSAGRRVELIQSFQKAKHTVGVTGTVVAIDHSLTAPALQFADQSYQVCKITDDSYISEVIEICQKEQIDLIVPTIDTELLKLAHERERIEKITQAKILISDLTVIELCRDKIQTQHFFEQIGLGVPKLIEMKDIIDKAYQFPLFIKPLNGSSSINTFKIKNEAELEFFLEYVPQPMVQSFITGTEYTIDAFVDFTHQPITIVPRERIATRSGEILKGKIVKDRELIDLTKYIIKKLEPIGHITIQCMKTSDGVKFIEINPRFGGGAPMSIHLGADSPANLYRLLRGEILEYNENYQEQVIVSRYDQAVYLKFDEKGCELL